MMQGLLPHDELRIEASAIRAAVLQLLPMGHPVSELIDIRTHCKYHCHWHPRWPEQLTSCGQPQVDSKMHVLIQQAVVRW